MNIVDLSCLMVVMIPPLFALTQYKCIDIRRCKCTNSGSNQPNNSAKFRITMDCTRVGLKELPFFNSSRDTRISTLLFGNNTLRPDNLSNKPFKGLQIEYLDLSNNVFNKIQFDAFSPLKSSLHTLILDNVGIKFKNLNFLKPLVKLKKLSLAINVIDRGRKLPSGIFPNIPIEELTISSNKFTRIDTTAFRNIQDTLRILYMENAGVDLTNLQFLLDMRKLESVYLGRNQLKDRDYTLMDQPFSRLGLESLLNIGLSHCNIMLLKENWFDGIENLTSLDLSYNKLRTIPNAIGRLAKLEYLNLEMNKQIDHLVDNNFERNVKLKQLKLAHTSIRILPGSAFSGLEQSLEYLDLSHSKLKGGHFWVFAMKHLHSVTTLNVSYNKIGMFVNDTFDFLLSLEHLDISGNMLQVEGFVDVFKTLQNSLTHFYIKNMTLDHLPNSSLSELESLDVLDASYNKFNMITKYFFSGIKAKQLNLFSCQIYNISLDAFYRLTGNVSLNLDSNYISNLSFIDALPSRFFSKLSLIDNPIKCDCTIAKILYYANVPDLRGSCYKQDGNWTTFTDLLGNESNMLYCGITRETLHANEGNNNFPQSVLLVTATLLFILIA